MTQRRMRRNAETSITLASRHFLRTPTSVTSSIGSSNFSVINTINTSLMESTSPQHISTLYTSIVSQTSSRYNSSLSFSTTLQRDNTAQRYNINTIVFVISSMFFLFQCWDMYIFWLEQKSEANIIVTVSKEMGRKPTGQIIGQAEVLETRTLR